MYLNPNIFIIILKLNGPPTTEGPINAIWLNFIDIMPIEIGHKKYIVNNLIYMKV